MDKIFVPSKLEDDISKFRMDSKLFVKNNSNKKNFRLAEELRIKIEVLENKYNDLDY